MGRTASRAATRRSRWLGFVAAVGALALLSSCGDDEQNVSAAERDAAIYSTVLREMVLAEIPPTDAADGDDSDALPILYVSGADGESVAVDVQAEVVKNLKDEAEIRFVDVPEDALVTDDESDGSGDGGEGDGSGNGGTTVSTTVGDEPVQDDGVLTIFGPLPEDGTTVQVDVEIYRNSADDRVYVVTLAGSQTKWVIRSVEPVG